MINLAKNALCLSFSIGIGFLLNQVTKPHDLYLTTIYWLVPFIVFGFRDDFLASSKTTTLLWVEVKNSAELYKQLVFWGVPIGKQHLLQGEYKWFGKTTKTDLANVWALMTEQVLPVAIKLMVPGGFVGG